MQRAPSAASRGSTKAVPARKSPCDSRFGGETESFERAVAKDRGHCQVGPLVDGNLGAQPVNQQPASEIGQTLGFGVEEYRL